MQSTVWKRCLQSTNSNTCQGAPLSVRGWLVVWVGSDGGRGSRNTPHVRLPLSNEKPIIVLKENKQKIFSAIRICSTYYIVDLKTPYRSTL